MSRKPLEDEAEKAFAVLAGMECEWCGKQTTDLWECFVHPNEDFQRRCKRLADKGQPVPHGPTMNFWAVGIPNYSKLCGRCAQNPYAQAKKKI